MVCTDYANNSSSRTGRRPSTTRAEISHVALKLFTENGFEQTTVDEVAQAANTSRRTIFRYFPSKNDLPWGDFQASLDDMREFLQAQPSTGSLTDTLSEAVLKFNRFPASEAPSHRARMQLLLTAPSLVAHSTLRYAQWRQVVADYAAERLGLQADQLEPQTIAWTYLGTSLSAYQQWLKEEGGDLTVLLRTAMAIIRNTFSTNELTSCRVHPAGSHTADS